MDCRQGLLIAGSVAWACLLSLAYDDQPIGELRVLPEEAQQFYSMGKGAYMPTALHYRFGNFGDHPFNYAFRCDAPWLTLSRTKGRLQPKGRGELILSIDPSAASRLKPGWHQTEVAFENATSGKGNTTRQVRLLMRSKSGLLVETAAKQEWVLDGAQGPTYRLTNSSESNLEWEARPSVEWIEVRPALGVLAPGKSVQLSVSGLALPNARQRADSEPDSEPGSVTFYNRTDGVGTTLRKLNLKALPQASDGNREDGRARMESETLTSITQYGITWTFAGEVQAGRYVSGDWWVVGPVLILNIDPSSRLLGTRVRNGSMINPSPKSGVSQGYDSATYAAYKSANSYVNKLNVALDVDLMQPLLLKTDCSLVSTISNPKPGHRPQLKAAAILTCVKSAPPLGAFRPAYAGHDKGSEFVESQLRTELLANLEAPASAPDWKRVERMFERPWIDHVPLWVGRYIHPSDNMPDYGREVCDAVSTGALMLHLDASPERKRTLLIHYVQLGIDLHGMLLDGGQWGPEGGHMSGRKWPILFAGLIFDDTQMQSIGMEYGPETFSEDGQTFYVTDPRPRLGYREEHRGLAEWGISHARNPEGDDARWRHTDKLPAGAKQDDKRSHGLKYRLCCTANVWWGQLLAARIMDARELWNHPPLFDYQDRYLEVNQKRRIFDYNLSPNKFCLEMWRLYRKDY